MNRLSIVVPYRDRAAHLQQFIGHVRAYFARDKLDRDIPYRVLIVEQEQGLPFNRGMLKNIGFLLGTDESDYTCFHDVDYLPIWADYSWIDWPSMILWYGAESRPVAPGRSKVSIAHKLDELFGGVVLIPNEHFRAVNGFANDYWGWGHEDTDLRKRFERAGIAFGRRNGTFIALEHDNEGLKIDGSPNEIANIRPSEIAEVNALLFKERWGKQGGAVSADSFIHDGLAQTGFKILERKIVPEPKPERAAVWEQVLVRLDGRPGAAQAEAYGKKATGNGDASLGSDAIAIDVR